MLRRFFAPLQLRRSHHCSWIFQRTHDGMLLAVLILAPLAFVPIWVGWLLARPLVLTAVVAGLVIVMRLNGITFERVRSVTVVRRILFGVPLPRATFLVGPLMLEEHEVEEDFGVFVPALLVGDALGRKVVLCPSDSGVEAQRQVLGAVSPVGDARTVRRSPYR